MRYSFYDTSPQRINPQFIGIATRYSSHKKKRLLAEEKKNELASDLMYTINLDASLDRQLQTRGEELSRLKEARIRHEQELAEKRALEQKRRRQIERLRMKNNNNRMDLRRGINTARQGQLGDNRRRKSMVEQGLRMDQQRRHEQMQTEIRGTLTKMMLARQDKSQGRGKVAEFHRKRNTDSLLQYKQQISQEKSKRLAYRRTISHHQKKLKVLNKTVEDKKSRLMDLQSQIYKYKTDIKTLALRQSRKRQEIPSDPTVSMFSEISQRRSSEV